LIIKEHVTIGIYYFMPDHKHLINEFYWQTLDITPEMPRTHQFLNFWKDNIDAIIKEVMVCHSYRNDWRKIDWEQRC